MRFNDLAAISPQLCFSLAIALTAIALWLARKLSRITSQLHRIKIKSGHTARQTAKDLSTAAHITGLRLLETTERLSDYYDTQQKAICLSVETASEASIAATGIVAHELGHAVQDKEHFWLMCKAGIIISWKTLTGNFILPVFVAGFLLDSVELILGGWVLFFLSAICNMMIYCLDHDASKRAEGWLLQDQFISREEERLIERFLRIAGLTYLSAIAFSPLEVFFTLGHGLNRLTHYGRQL